MIDEGVCDEDSTLTAFCFLPMFFKKKQHLPLNHPVESVIIMSGRRVEQRRPDVRTRPEEETLQIRETRFKSSFEGFGSADVVTTDHRPALLFNH